jgi:hypothetical protein
MALGMTPPMNAAVSGSLILSAHRSKSSRVGERRMSRSVSMIGPTLRGIGQVTWNVHVGKYRRERDTIRIKDTG